MSRLTTRTSIMGRKHDIEREFEADFEGIVYGLFDYDYDYDYEE